MSKSQYSGNFISWQTIENTRLIKRLDDIIAKHNATDLPPTREPWARGSWKWAKIRDQHLRAENIRLRNQREIRNQIGHS